MSDQEFQIGLILLPVTEYDIILDSRLLDYHVVLEYFHKKLIY